MKDLIKAKVNQKLKKKIKILYSIYFCLSIIISIAICSWTMITFDLYLGILGNMFVIGFSFIGFMGLQILIPYYLTHYAFKKEIKLFFEEDLKALEPVKFQTNWELEKNRKFSKLGYFINIDKDTGYIYFSKDERIDNYAHYYVIDTMYSDERMYVVQKAYDDTNNIPKILREVKVNKFVNGFKG